MVIYDRLSGYGWCHLYYDTFQICDATSEWIVPGTITC